MHEQFLLASLEQAWLGQGRCAPNPPVGAVAVQRGKILARASHPGAGKAHAEQLLLAQFAPMTPEVVVYVTLEPCNHWGKTPPCVEALIRHGVEGVVFGYRDPNPVVAKNNTPGLLEQAGIWVKHIALPAIQDFYAAYRQWIQTGNPHVTAKIAQSLDGCIAAGEGVRTAISNADSARFTHTARKHADVILTTVSTVLCDNPLLNVRLDGDTEARPVAILDSRCRLRADANVLKTASHCHVFHHASMTPVALPNTTHHAISGKPGKLALPEVLAKLGQLGFHSVFVEGGGTLLDALHRERLVNRTLVIVAPRLLGRMGVPAYHDPDIFVRPHTVVWQQLGDNVVACVDWTEGC